MVGWRNLVALGLFCAPPLFALDYYFGLPRLVGYGDISITETISRQQFDGDTWKKARETDVPIRLKMVDDLLLTHHLVGMSKAQVDALLGPPDQTSHFSGLYNRVYWLGPERGFISIDSEWLGLRVDNDVVVEAAVVRD